MAPESSLLKDTLWGGLVTKSCLSLVTPWTVAHQLLCSWDSPGKNTGVGCHFLLQGNLSDPGIELRSPALQTDSYQLNLPSGADSLNSVLEGKYSLAAPPPPPIPRVGYEDLYCCVSLVIL